MYTGWIISDSLEKEDFLSEVEITKEETEKDPETGDSVTFYTVEIDDEIIDKITGKMEKSLKNEWYVHLTNGENLIIVFKDRTFKMELDSMGEDTGFGVIDFRIRPQEAEKWQELLTYATKEVNVDLNTMINVEWY